MTKPSSLQKDLENADRIAKLMDSAFRIPGTQVRIGWESLIGLIPVVGDTLGSLSLVYFLIIGLRQKVPASVLFLMIWRHIVDLLLGSVPLVGDIFDIFYRANEKNAQSLREALAQKANTPHLES